MAKTTHRRAVTYALLSSVLMSALEGTAVSTAMPAVIGELGGMKFYAWVFASYMFASSVTVPLFGKLGDQYGRRPVFVFGLISFLVGSLLCGCAQNIFQLIAFRLIQGLGAGAMQPTSLTLFGDLYEIDERAKMQAFFSSLWAGSAVLGPMFGSLMVASIGWRWIFWVNLPFGFLSLFLFLKNYHESVAPKPHQIDILGFACLIGLFSCLMMVAEGMNSYLLMIVAAVF